jgi:hypothetical protein
MQSTTFGDSPAAKTLALIIEEQPEKRRRKAWSAVSRILHHYYDTLAILSRGLKDYPETAGHAILLLQKDGARRVQASGSTYLTPLMRDLMCNLMKAKARFYFKIASSRSKRFKDARPRATLATHYIHHHIALLEGGKAAWITPDGHHEVRFACLTCGVHTIRKSDTGELFHCLACENTWEVVPKEE